MGARERRGTAHSLRPVGVCIDAHLSARLLRRYKRFLADVETDAGEKLTVHCPDPGSMRGCALPGAPVRCSTSDNPNRKLRHTLEMIRVGRVWVGVNTGRANHVVARALAAGALPELSGYTRHERSILRQAEKTSDQYREQRSDTAPPTLADALADSGEVTSGEVRSLGWNRWNDT